MDVREYLKKQGYLNSHADPIHREALVHYKRMPDTQKHQLEVVEWPELSMMGRRYDVTMTFETEHECWATIKFYGLTAELLVARLSKLEARLKQSMVYMGANPMHYRFDGQD